MQEGTEISSGHRQETSADPGDDARAGDVYARDCPTRLLLDRIADKWTVLLLTTLAGEPMRFNALKRRIEGVSQKMLTQTLRSLERDGFVRRTSYPVVPPHVEYQLTELGASLHTTLRALSGWAVEHMDTVAQQQADYDALVGGQRKAG